MKKLLSLILATAMIATLFIGTSVFAAESSSSSEEGSTDTYVFTYATVDAEGSDHDRLVESKLKELLEEKSGGRMTLEVYYSSSLTGVGSTLDGIKNGTVDMGYDACGFYGAVFPYTGFSPYRACISATAMKHLKFFASMTKLSQTKFLKTTISWPVSSARECACSLRMQIRSRARLTLQERHSVRPDPTRRWPRPAAVPDRACLQQTFTKPFV